MKNKLKYNLTKVKQIETETPVGKSVTLLFDDGRRIDMYAENFIQLLAWLEIDEDGKEDVNDLVTRLRIAHDVVCTTESDKEKLDIKHLLLEVIHFIESITY